MNRRGKVLLVTLAVALPMVLGGAGTAYAAHYQDRALPGSSVAGDSVAGMTRDEVAAAVRQRADAVEVTVDAGGVTRTSHLADLGYSVDVDATVDAVFDANGSWSSYATSLVHPRDVDAVVHTDTSRVGSVVDSLVEASGRVGKNAGVRLASDKRSFEVVPAVTGQTIEPASFQDVVAAAARHLHPTSVTARFVDTDPAVTNAAAAKVAAEANALVDRTVALADGNTAHTASTQRKASWVTIPTEGGTLGTPGIDAAKVRSWVKGLAEDLKVSATDGLRNVDKTGKVLSVVTWANDGRTATNAGDLATAALAALASGKDYTGAFAFDTVQSTWTDRLVAAGAEKLAYPAAEGEKWVDVDLTKHTMTAYTGATKVYGPIEMVSGGKDFPTVTGTYHVYLKYAKMDMKGTNADGTPYLTKDVPWVSFFYQGIALHGAYWRDSFGYTGSHGCVNLPVADAKWVYDFAPVGTPVVSHY